METTTYTISNIAGGDLRRFRATDGQPSGASIRHARRQGHMGYLCSDPQIHTLIEAALCGCGETGCPQCDYAEEG